MSVVLLLYGLPIDGRLTAMFYSDFFLLSIMYGFIYNVYECSVNKSDLMFAIVPSAELLPWYANTLADAYFECSSYFYFTDMFRFEN